jgi:quercetin dioxygenase-like cupin family protein
MEKSAFFAANELPVEDLGEGVSRQILGYDKDIMMVKVNFEKGAIGKAHRHPHRQTSFVASGVFEVNIGADTKTLNAGDAFYAGPDEVHGVVCLESGTLIDVFNPVREDFLK